MKKPFEFINLTPHAIVLHDGEFINATFEPSGSVARVSTEVKAVDGFFYRRKFGEVINLPEPKENVFYIVSAMVKSAVKGRKDVVAPATDAEGVIRNDKGHIVSVPGFIFEEE